MTEVSATSGHGADLVLELGGHLPQLVGAVAGGGERQRQDRHVVDRMRLHQRRQRAGRQPVHVGEEFGVDPGDAPFLVLTDLESHRDKGVTLAGHRVHMLDRRDLPHPLLDRPGDEILDLGRGGARQCRDHVDHRHRDLGFLLARCRQDTDQPHRQRRDRHQRCELGMQEPAGQPSGEAHGQWLPSRMTSPDFRPERTSTRGSVPSGTAFTHRNSLPPAVFTRTPVRSPS